jgi:ABC-type sugar transport system substrate-binding protein
MSQRGKVAAVRGLIALFAGLTFVVFLAACGGGGGSSSSDEPTEEQNSSGATSETASAEGSSSIGGKKLVLINCSHETSNCVKTDGVFEEKAKEAGLDFTLITNQTYEASEAAAHISQALAHGPDVIVTNSAVQEGMRPVLLKAQQAGVPVIFIGSPPDESNEGLVASSAGPSMGNGEMAAEVLLEGLEKAGVKSGKIMTVNGSAGTNEEEMLEGMKKVLSGTPFEIVAEAPGEWDPTTVVQATQPLYAKYGNELVGVLGENGAMAAAAAKSASQAGFSPGTKAGEILVVGALCDATSVAAIKNGTMYGVAVDGAVQEGEAGFELAEMALEGKELPPVKPDTIYPGTKENVSKYEEICNF